MVAKIIGIWAEDDKHVIGYQGRLPWHLPKELHHFKASTLGHTLVMGRVTFDGMKRRLLPNRETIILSRDLVLETPRPLVMRNVDEIMAWANEHSQNLFVVGGARVYKAFEPYYDELIKTHVHGEFDGDTYFPEIDWSRFEQHEEQFFEKDDHNAYDFTVKRFVKKG